MTKKVLGFWTLTALTAGNMIGSGVFLLPASLAKFGNVSLIAWIFTTIGAIVLALVFARLSQRIHSSGGPYAFCRTAFGDFIGFEIAYNYWIAIWVGNGAIVVGLASYLGYFWPGLDHEPMSKFLIEVVAIWVLTLINIFGVKTAGIVQIFTMILKLLPLILVIIFGLTLFDPSHFTTLNIPQQHPLISFSAAATMTLWSFIGLESATVPSEAATHPKTVARATVFGTSLAGLVYILSFIAVVGIVSYQNLQTDTQPFATAADLAFAHVGGWFGIPVKYASVIGGALISFGAIVACAGSINGWIMLQGQVPMAAARDGLFLKIFGEVDKNNTPVKGLIISAICITLLLTLTLNQGLIKQFTFILLLATLATVIPYFFSACAELLFIMKNPTQYKHVTFVRNVTITIAAVIYAGWTIMGAGQDIVYYGVILLLSGVPIYALMQWSQTSRKEKVSKQNVNVF